MFDISPIQILIVLVIALLVFGPKRLPEMGKSIGRGIREFKTAIVDDEPRPAPAPPTPAAPAATAASTESSTGDGQRRRDRRGRRPRGGRGAGRPAPALP